MPYKSDAQRKFMHAAMDRGDIKPSVVHDFDKASKEKKNLPEYVPGSKYKKLRKFMKKKDD